MSKLAALILEDLLDLYLDDEYESGFDDGYDTARAHCAANRKK